MKLRFGINTVRITHYAFESTFHNSVHVDNLRFTSLGVLLKKKHARICRPMYSCPTYKQTNLTNREKPEQLSTTKISDERSSHLLPFHSIHRSLLLLLLVPSITSLSSLFARLPICSPCILLCSSVWKAPLLFFNGAQSGVFYLSTYSYLPSLPRYNSRKNNSILRRIIVLIR